MDRIWQACLIVAAIVVATTGFGRAAFAQAFDDVPLPDDIRIEAPPSSADPVHTAFLGRWQGVWAETLNAIVVVESIKPPTATVVYGHGRAPSWGVEAGTWYRVPGEFDGNSLVIVSPNTGTSMAFSIDPDGTMKAVARPRVGTTHTDGEFSRFDQ